MCLVVKAMFAVGGGTLQMHERHQMAMKNQQDFEFKIFLSFKES
jgi:hypothetical protein